MIKDKTPEIYNTQHWVDLVRVLCDELTNNNVQIATNWKTKDTYKISSVKKLCTELLTQYTEDDRVQQNEQLVIEITYLQTMLYTAINQIETSLDTYELNSPEGWTISTTELKRYLEATFTEDEGPYCA